MQGDTVQYAWSVRNEGAGTGSAIVTVTADFGNDGSVNRERTATVTLPPGGFQSGTFEFDVSGVPGGTDINLCSDLS